MLLFENLLLTMNWLFMLCHCREVIVPLKFFFLYSGFELFAIQVYETVPYGLMCALD